MSILFLIFSEAQCQNGFREGYIITIDMDTIHGFINNQGYTKNSQCCVFKNDFNSKKKEYLPFEIYGYRIIGDKYYISKEIEKDNQTSQIFVEVLINSSVNLYYYRERRKDHYYIEKDDREFIELIEEKQSITVGGHHYRRNNKLYIGILKLYLEDCLLIQSEINDVKLNHESLISIAEKYNKLICEKKTCTTFKKKVPIPRYTYGIALGYSNTRLNFIRTDGSSEFSKSLPIGVFINRTFPLSSERVSFQLELIFEKNQIDNSFFTNYLTLGSGGLYGDGSGFVTHNLYSTVSFNYSSFCLPAFIKVEFPIQKITPYMGLGITNHFFYNSIVNRSTSIQYENNIEPYLEENLRLDSYAVGFLVDLGIEYKLRKSQLMFVKARLVGYKNEVVDDPIQKYYQIKSFTLSTGVIF